MRLIYLDAALSSHVGHHANGCRMVIREVARRGIPYSVVTPTDISPELRDELQATPLFRWRTYRRLHIARDPISGWLRDFEEAWKNTVEDLQKLPPLRPDDVVYLNSALPAQFMAMVQWLRQIPLAQRPRTVIEFGGGFGLQAVVSPNGRRHFEVPDPRRDARSLLFHHVATLLEPDDRSRLTLITFDRTVSEVYQGLIGSPVSTFPLPLSATTSCRPGTRKRPIVISVLGHQREDKGYDLVPEIVKGLLDLPDVEFLIHNAAPQEMRTPQNALRDLAKADARIRLDESPAAGDRWAELLDASDLIVCPYDPNRYAASYSAVMAECVANAVPAVVPASTSLSALANDFAAGYTEFKHWTAAAVIAAVREAVAQFDVLADRSHAAALKWPTSHGPAHVVDAILGS